MDDRNIRDLKLFGTLAAVSGTLLMLLTFLAAGLVLVTGGSTSLDAIVRGIIIFITSITMSAGLIGTGGAFQRAGRTPINDIRLDWTALLVIMMVSLGASLIFNIQPLSLVAATVLVGLFWVRPAVINLTNR
jgi:hypothetical protein